MPEHVVVIGAGIVGLCAADELLKRGYKVTVLERDSTPGNGCSYGNGGLIVPSHFEPLAAPGMIAMGLRMMRDRTSPFGVSGLPSLQVLSWMAKFGLAATESHVERCAPVLRDMHLASREMYADTYADIADQAGFEHKGELLICRSKEALEGELHFAERANKLGMKTNSISKKELQQFEPECEIEAEGAIFFEDDGKIYPKIFMPALRKRVLKQGAIVIEGAQVNDIICDSFKVKYVRTASGNFDADTFVIAAGVWTDRLSRMAGARVPLLAGKGYGFTVTHPPQTPRLPALLIEGRMAVTPMNDGLRFVGSMELQQPGSLAINQQRVDGMRRSIAQYYPAFRGLDFAPFPVWSGLRPCAPDGMPYIGRTSRCENLIFAAGHGMMGMSLGPVSGRLVAEAVASEPASIPLQTMSPDRYA